MILFFKKSDFTQLIDSQSQFLIISTDFICLKSQQLGNEELVDSS